MNEQTEYEGVQTDDGRDAIRNLSFELAETKKKCGQQITETLELVSRLQEKSSSEKTLRQALAIEENLAEERLQDLREYQSLCVKKERSLTAANQTNDELQQQLLETEEKLKISESSNKSLQISQTETKKHFQALQQQYSDHTRELLSQLQSVEKNFEENETKKWILERVTSTVQSNLDKNIQLQSLFSSNPSEDPDSLQQLLSRHRDDSQIRMIQQAATETLQKSSKNHLDSLSKLQSDYQNEIIKHKNAVSNSNTTIKVLQADLTTLQEHCAALRSAAEDRDAKRISSIKELQGANSRLQQQLSVSNKDSISSIKTEDLQQKISQYETVIKKMEDQHNDLSKKSQKSEHSRQSVMSQYNSLVDEKSKLNSQVSSLQNEYKTESDRNSELRSVNMSLVRDCENQSAQVISMKEELAQYRRTISKKDSEVEQERILSSKINSDVNKLIEESHQTGEQLIAAQQVCFFHFYCSFKYKQNRPA